IDSDPLAGTFIERRTNTTTTTTTTTTTPNRRAKKTAERASTDRKLPHVAQRRSRSTTRTTAARLGERHNSSAIGSNFPSFEGGRRCGGGHRRAGAPNLYGVGGYCVGNDM